MKPKTQCKTIHGQLATRYAGNRDYLIPHTDSVPDDVADRLTAKYGRPETIDRGGTAYWVVPA